MTFTPWKARAAAITSGLMLGAAFPPWNVWPLALVALVPILLAIASRSSASNKALQALNQPLIDLAKAPQSGRAPHDTLETQGLDGFATTGAFWAAFRLGWIFGLVFFTATLWWIEHVTLLGMLAMTCYLALYPAVALGIAGWLGLQSDQEWKTTGGKLLLIAGVWIGLEWCRSIALSGFPWNGLAVPLFSLRGLASLASTVGVIGLSGLVILFSATVALGLRAKQCSGKVWCYGTILFFLLSAGLLERQITLRRTLTEENKIGSSHSRSISVVLIQPNVKMEEKLSLEPEVRRQRYFDLVAQTEAALISEEGEQEKELPDLVVWPESAVPGFFDEMVAGGAFSDPLKLGDFSLITGADHAEWGKLYNSMAAMRGTTANRAIHAKVRLVPFGEFIPFRKQVPLFEKMLGDLIPMDFVAGTSFEPMRVKGQDFSVIPLVCFEDTIGDHARKFVKAEPQLIVNVTNDNWFHESPGTEMHFVNARWRAVELNRTLVRSANTGVTALVTRGGEVQRLPSHQIGTLKVKCDLGDNAITFYAQHGDLVSQVVGALALMGCGAVSWQRRNRHKVAS